MKARGRREGKGGEEEKRRPTRGGVLKMKSFGAHGRVHAMRNNLNIYIIEITQIYLSILYFSLLNLLFFQFPWKLCVRTGLNRATPTGPDPCFGLTPSTILYSLHEQCSLVLWRPVRYMTAFSTCLGICSYMYIVHVRRLSIDEAERMSPITCMWHRCLEGLTVKHGQS